MIAICSSSRPFGTLAGGLVLALSAAGAFACSAPGDGSDDELPPPFVGVGSTQPGAPGAGGAGNPGSTPSTGPNTEGNPSNAPLTGGTPNDGSPGGVSPGNTPGAGGASGGNVMGTVPGVAGAGGAPGAMAGAAGSGNMPPVSAAGSTGMPPQTPPVTPPPVMQPPFAGAGCDGSAFFCEDFEDLPLGGVQANAAFTPSTANGSLTIDSVNARGQRALHVQTNGNGRAYIQLNNFAPPNNSFFARMYVYVQQFPSAPNYAHFTLVEAAGQGAGLVRPIGGQFIQEENGVFWGPGSDAGPTGDWTNWRTTTPAEPGRFLCIEWEMNDADNNINVWLDSQPKPELSVSTNVHGGNQVPFQFPQFNNLWIGWQLYQGGPTPNQFNLWFDDIVFSTVRVGC